MLAPELRSLNERSQLDTGADRRRSPQCLAKKMLALYVTEVDATEVDAYSLAVESAAKKQLGLNRIYPQQGHELPRGNCSPESD